MALALNPVWSADEKQNFQTLRRAVALHLATRRISKGFRRTETAQAPNSRGRRRSANAGAGGRLVETRRHTISNRRISFQWFLLEFRRWSSAFRLDGMPFDAARGNHAPKRCEDSPVRSGTQESQSAPFSILSAFADLHSSPSLAIDGLA